jgi:hypothetical protein
VVKGRAHRGGCAPAQVKQRCLGRRGAALARVFYYKYFNIFSLLKLVIFFSKTVKRNMQPEENEEMDCRS